MRKILLKVGFALCVTLSLLNKAAATPGTADFIATSGLVPLKGSILTRHAGGPVLIQFWASWCHRCSSLFGELSAFTDDHPGLTYLAVSIDREQRDAIAYLQKHQAVIAPLKNMSFAIDDKNVLTERFQVHSAPEVVLLDADGTLLTKISGHFNKKDLFTMSEKLKPKKRNTH